MRRKSTLAVVIILAVLGSAIDSASAAGTKFLQRPQYHDGNVVFTYMGDIWIQPPQGQARPMTLHPDVDTRPVISPDGKWIAFVSNRTGNWDIFVIPFGGGVPRQLTYHSGSDVAVAWTIDSKKIIFRTARASVFTYQFYSVNIEGEAIPELYLAAGAGDGLFNLDGRYFVYTQKSSRYTRRGYVGSSNTKIYVYDTEKKSIRRLLEGDTHQNSPLIVGDNVYYSSEQNGGYNIWRVPLSGGKTEQVTKLTENGAINLSLSTDGKTIVFEHEFDIWKLDIATGEVAQVPISIAADYRELPVEHRNFGKCEDFCISPDGERVAVSTHGEIFTVPVKEGRVRQVTNSAARDRGPKYSPDGKTLAFISDMNLKEEVYIVGLDGGKPEKLTDADTRKHEIEWSPDGSRIAVTMSDHTLRVYDVKDKSHTVLIKYREASPYDIEWSPDGKWIAYLKPNADLMRDVCIISAVDENPREHVIVEDMPLDEYIVTFTKEKLFFLGATELEGTFHLYSVSLAAEEKDPDDPEVKAEKKKPTKPGKKTQPPKKDDEPKKEEAKQEKKEEGGETEEEKKTDASEKPEKKEEKPKLPEVKIDFDRIEKRVRKLCEVKGELESAAVSPDGKKTVLIVKEPQADKEVDVMYLFDPDSEKSKFARIGEVKEVEGLTFSSNGKEVYYLSGGRIYHRKPAPGSPEVVRFSVRVRISTTEEYAQIFNEVWRIIKHTFYDPDMHGVNWDEIYRKYSAVLPTVADRDALSTLLNRMLGELKASHMGYRPVRGASGSGYSTMSLGLDLEPDQKSGLYRVSHICEYGPASKDWANVSEGDYLLEIDGKSLKAGDNYYRMLNHPLNDRVDLTLSTLPDGSDNRTTRIQLVSSRDLWYLRYHEWVRSNRARVEEKSGGRLAYIHILSMSMPWYERFRRELQQYRQKDGLIIDVRNNGGGRIDTYLLDVLERKMYGYRIWRDSVPIDRPSRGFYGPKAVLINESSFSNAEIFPRGFRDLGLGKLIGRPTGGGVIGTTSYSLIDGSSIRTPRVAAFAIDGTNLENWGVKPDIDIDRTPEDQLAGRDPQLDTAIAEVMKQLPPAEEEPEKKPIKEKPEKKETEK
ncbi:MAG: S41 family peptidase [Planctomycetota bacterium]